jgi:O-antigen/teichoic acid export membrane protein
MKPPRDTIVDPPDVLASREAGPLAIRGGMLRIGGYALGLLFALASLPLLTRHLGVGDFGGYVTVLSLITIVGLVSDAGLTIVGIREYSVRDGPHRRRLMTNLLGLRICVAALGVAGATVFAVAAGYDDALVAGTALAGAGLVLLVVQQTWSVPLNSELRLGLVTGFDVLRQALLAAGIVILVVAGAGLFEFLAVPIPVGLAVAALTVLAIRGRAFVLPTFERDEWRYLIGEALPVALASTIGSFFYRVAIIMMSLIATAQETGYFSASFRIVEAIVMVPGLITAAAFPILARAAHEDEDRLAYTLQRLFDIGVIAGAWMAVCIVLGAQPAIDVIGGSEFEPAVPVLRIQGVAVAASFLVAVWATGLWATRGQRSLVVANLIGVVAAAGLTALLIPSAGAEGAAIAMTAAELLLAGCYAFALMRDRPRLRPALGVVPKTLLAVAPAGALWLVPAPDAVLVVAATVVFFGVLLALRGIPPDVWEALAARRRTSGA